MTKKKSCNSFNYNHKTYVEFDDNGFLISASELRGILWCVDPDNIDKSIVDKHMHIREFSELLHKYGANKEMKESFDEVVMKQVEKGIQRKEIKSKVLSLFKKS